MASQTRMSSELMGRIREAIPVCLEADGDPLEPLEFIGIQKVSVAGHG